MSDAKKTTDHQKIKSWTEAHGGVPTVVKGTESGSGKGVLRIHFPKASSDQDFKEISWDEFFEQFEENKLAFLYQDEKDSTFHKFVNRDN